MQDAQEAFKSLVTQVKVTYHKWEIRHLWPARILESIILFLVIVIGVTRIFARLDLYSTDPVSARYMLSAMVQAQAAIVAIVITLTLVAVQLTASAYSPRVTRIFGENPDMRLLLLFYGGSISYGFLVLKQIRADELMQTYLFGYNLEHHLVCAYSIGGFTFLMLFPYMRNTINLLNPSTLLDRLTVKITKNNLFDSNDDPIQPVIDIVHGSIMRYDLATTRFGLNTLTDQIAGLIVTELAADDHRAAVTVLDTRFCIPVVFVGKLAVSIDDEKSTVEVIENLQKFGESVVRKVTDEFTGLTFAAWRTVSSLEVVGCAAADKKLGDAAWRTATSLEEVGRTAVDKGLESVVVRTAYSLEEVGRTAADKGLERVVVRTTSSLEEVGRTAADKGLERVVVRTTSSLEVVGRTAADKGLEGAVWQATYSLGEIGRVAADKELEGAAERAVYSLGVVGRAAADKGLEGAVWQAAHSLQYIGVATLIGLQDVATEAAKSLAELALVKKEIVDKAFHEIKSELENGENREAFGEFAALYDRELEELRKEKEKKSCAEKLKS